MFDAVQSALYGGLMIGAAATLLLLLNGRIAGISGIFAGLLLHRPDAQTAWRLAFLLGLVLGYLALRAWRPELAQMQLQTNTLGMIVAGLLVGYGTRMGSGCTSGHGICGIALLSARSLVATLTFMLIAIITVAILRHSGVFS